MGMARSVKNIALIAAGLLVLAGGIIVFRVITMTEKTWKSTSVEVKNRSFPLKTDLRKIASQLPGELLQSSKRIFDVAFFAGDYHVATSGGIHILDADFREKKHLTTLNGLAELEVRKLIDGDGLLYLLYRSGRFAALAADGLTNFTPPAGIVIRDGVWLQNQLILASDRFLFVKQENELRKFLEFTGIKKIFGGSRLYVVGEDNHVYRAGNIFQKIDLQDLKQVENAREIGDSVYIASVSGVLSTLDNHLLFPGLWIKDIESFAGQLIALSSNGEVLTSRSTLKLVSGHSAHLHLKTANGLLFAMSDEGLFVFDRQKWRRIGLTSDLPDPFVTTLSVNRGILWAGTLEQGFFSLKQRFLLQEYPQVWEINDSVVYRGDVRFASTMGVVMLRNGRAMGINGTERFYVNALAGSGDTLFAGTSSGLLQVVGDQVELFNLFQKLSNNKIYCLAQGDGGLWCGTMGGITFYDGRQFIPAATSLTSGIKDNWMTNLALIEGSLYFSTYNGEFGLLEPQSGKVTVLDRQPIKFNFNNMVYRPPYVLAGTYGRGIYIFNLETGISRFFQRGLPSLNVTDLAIQEDTLAISTDSGILFVPVNDFFAADGT